MSIPRVRLRPVIVALAVVLVLAGLGVGAYVVGNSGGENLTAARAAGISAGSKAGKHRGEHQGYARGFKRGRSQSFERAYDDAFRQAYASAFKDTGIPPPRHVYVPAAGGAKPQVPPGD